MDWNSNPKPYCCRGGDAICVAGLVPSIKQRTMAKSKWPHPKKNELNVPGKLKPQKKNGTIPGVWHGMRVELREHGTMYPNSTNNTEPEFPTGVKYEGYPDNVGGIAPEAMNIAMKAITQQNQMVPSNRTYATHIIGIDPGAHTGFAIWDCKAKKITQIATFDFWECIEKIYELAYSTHFNFSDVRTEIAVVIENPGGNRPTFREHQTKFREKLSQNIGMNKRDAQLIIQYCERSGIKVLPIIPGKHSQSKVKPDVFSQITCWIGRTSQHGRDAAMLVFQHSPIELTETNG